MKDRLQFRIWDPLIEKMRYFSMGELMAYNMKEIHPVRLSGFREEDVTQSTGFKDENGKLIFEGDIIEFYQAGCDNIMGKVYMSEEAEYRIDWFDGDGSNLFCFSNACEIVGNACEIVGNIYENPCSPT